MVIQRYDNVNWIYFILDFVWYGLIILYNWCRWMPIVFGSNRWIFGAVRSLCFGMSIKKWFRDYWKKFFSTFQNRTEIWIVIGEETAGNLSIFKGHSAELAWLDVNHDGSLLASGDVRGVYMIWDISSRQCLKTSSLKGIFHEISNQVSAFDLLHIFFKDPSVSWSLLRNGKLWKALVKRSKKHSLSLILNGRKEKKYLHLHCYKMKYLLKKFHHFQSISLTVKIFLKSALTHDFLILNITKCYTNSFPGQILCWKSG